MTAQSISLRLLTLLVAVQVCTVAHAELIHRYSFNDPADKDTPVKDSAGKIDAHLIGPAKVADGKLVLENADQASGDAQIAYLEFAEAIAPKSGSVSFVVWITAKENQQYARVLDIGDTEDGQGRAFIYLLTRHQDDKCRGAISATDTASKTYLTHDRLDDEKPHMAVLVIDGAEKKLHLYVDGKESEADAATPPDLGDNTLDQVRPVHSWIGRSGFDTDPGLSASIDEFRVYDSALSAEEIAAIQKAGPDALPPKKSE